MVEQISPKWNGWALSNAGFEPERVSFRYLYSTRAVQAVAAELGVSPESVQGGLLIRLSGNIGSATSNEDTRDKWAELLARLRGNDLQTRGQLSIHADGHYLAQLAAPVEIALKPGVGHAGVTLDFFADDPFRRLSPKVSISEVFTGVTTYSISIFWGATSDFVGDAPRIPLTIDLGSGWLAGEVVRIENVTTGERFEHVVVENLATNTLVIDGELGEIDYGGVVVSEGISGNFPWIRGGETNTLDFTGTDRWGTFSFEFWDRVFG